ncbi:Hypothetical protein NCS54_00988500 [Fusarium falciforme]|uniref:Hypothetical protein n=1 Tax=Fusarium falciforme TaxID=195108 RepID=UPI002300EF10|nr:Hypothetical protein NCS54_00988500 [Fusarium falciforme]WAO92379.1 Hypothetical protein NCS54_00988500 [Fusarium falciforme]
MGCLEAMPEPHRSQMRLLTEWIDQNYDGIYAEAERKFERGHVSWSTMPFFVRPGEVLVTKDDKGIQGYIAESWAMEKAAPQPFRSSLREEHHFAGSWSVKAWSYGYDGQFFRQNTILDINLEFDDIHRDIDMAELAEGERYMIDFGTYKQLYSESPKFKASYPSLTSTDRNEMSASVMKCETPPEGPELFVFPSKLIGYNLRQKQWRDLEVDLVQDVCWNKQAFAHLVINDETMDPIQALVTSKLETEERTDLIHGKGNGLIILLHGVPGTGKTFTAESVAKIAEKPLYRVTCGDIGTKPEVVEKYLESVLYLEQRTLMDLERNALVSVFLRVLEYYEGILVLTSNRVGTFDEAFKSRIQLSLHYEALSKSKRRMIWSNFLCRLKTLERDSTKMKPIGQRKRKFEEPKGINFDNIERHLGDLAEHEMNGRQIRNAITTARQLAKFKGDEMEYRYLKHVIETSRKFDKYLESVRENYTDDQIARGEGFR